MKTNVIILRQGTDRMAFCFCKKDAAIVRTRTQMLVSVVWGIGLRAANQLMLQHLSDGWTRHLSNRKNRKQQGITTANESGK